MVVGRCLPQGTDHVVVVAVAVALAVDSFHTAGCFCSCSSIAILGQPNVVSLLSASFTTYSIQVHDDYKRHMAQFADFSLFSHIQTTL